HGWKNYPYVGYGHQLQPGEHFTADMTEWQADSLLRADLWKCFEHFKGYGKDALLLSLLAYNVGVGRLLGYGKHPKCRLLRKIESGDRNFYWEYVSFCRYKGNVLRGLFKRRQLEFNLFFIR
ncbi:MAG: lysozyme, partial [Prevotella histicola]